MKAAFDQQRRWSVISDKLAEMVEVMVPMVSGKTGRWCGYTRRLSPDCVEIEVKVGICDTVSMSLSEVVEGLLPSWIREVVMLYRSCATNARYRRSVLMICDMGCIERTKSEDDFKIYIFGPWQQGQGEVLIFKRLATSNHIIVQNWLFHRVQQYINTSHQGRHWSRHHKV